MRLAFRDEQDWEPRAPDDFFSHTALVRPRVLASMPSGHRDEVAAQVQGGVEDLVYWDAPAHVLFRFDAKLVELLSMARKVTFICPRQFIVC